MDWKIIFIWVFPLGSLGNHEDINKLGDYAIAYNYIDEDAISKLESQHSHSQEQYTCLYSTYVLPTIVLFSQKIKIFVQNNKFLKNNFNTFLLDAIHDFLNFRGYF